MVIDVTMLGPGELLEFKTTVQGGVVYECGCGHPVRVKVYAKKRGKTDYRTVVTHRTRTQTSTSKDGDSMKVLNHILRVCSYAKCRLPLKAVY